MTLDSYAPMSNYSLSSAITPLVQKQAQSASLTCDASYAAVLCVNTQTNTRPQVMQRTLSYDVQLSLAREIADKANRYFYDDINEGFAKAITSALNDAGYILHIKLGKASFVKDISSSMVAIRTDNIYQATPLAIVLAAHAATEHLPRIKPEGVFHATF